MRDKVLAAKLGRTELAVKLYRAPPPYPRL